MPRSIAYPLITSPEDLGETARQITRTITELTCGPVLRSVLVARDVWERLRRLEVIAEPPVPSLFLAGIAVYVADELPDGSEVTP